MVIDIVASGNNTYNNGKKNDNTFINNRPCLCIFCTKWLYKRHQILIYCCCWEYWTRLALRTSYSSFHYDDCSVKVVPFSPCECTFVHHKFIYDDYYSWQSIVIHSHTKYMWIHKINSTTWLLYAYKRHMIVEGTGHRSALSYV